MMDNVIEFKKRLKESAPAGMRYVLVAVFDDGSDGYVEHSESLNGYEALGILEWGKMIKLAECSQ